MLQYGAPVLSACFAPDGKTVYAAGCDNFVKIWDLASGKHDKVAQHNAPVKEVHYVETQNVLITGSWDKTVKYWDPRSASAPKGSIDMPERVYSMDVRGNLIVVATADRHVVIIDARKPTTIFNKVESPLKMQTRCIAAFPDQTGYAIASVEGRCGIQHVDEKMKEKNFAFKCHRAGDHVYAVNGIAFHPLGTFATVGGDGRIYFWDKDSRSRLKEFNKGDQPISCGSFNRDGSIFAYAFSYDWSKGVQHYDKSKPNNIFLHQVLQAEIVPKK